VCLLATPPVTPAANQIPGFRGGHCLAPVPLHITGESCAVSLIKPSHRYLVLFLKFIASVVPTIHYDFSMSVGNSS
jgi:hypothetical protein